MDARKRRDICKVCGGPVYVLKWASNKPRKCHGCSVKYRAERLAQAQAFAKAVAQGMTEGKRKG